MLTRSQLHADSCGRSRGDLGLPVARSSRAARRWQQRAPHAAPARGGPAATLAREVLGLRVGGRSCGSSVRSRGSAASERSSHGAASAETSANRAARWASIARIASRASTANRGVSELSAAFAAPGSHRSRARGPRPTPPAGTARQSHRKAPKTSHAVAGTDAGEAGMVRQRFVQAVAEIPPTLRRSAAWRRADVRSGCPRRTSQAGAGKRPADRCWGVRSRRHSSPAPTRARRRGRTRVQVAIEVVSRDQLIEGVRVYRREEPRFHAHHSTLPFRVRPHADERPFPDGMHPTTPDRAVPVVRT